MLLPIKFSKTAIKFWQFLKLFNTDLPPILTCARAVGQLLRAQAAFYLLFAQTERYNAYCDFARMAVLLILK